MTSWHARWRFPLWLRIWIAVVAAVAVLSIAFGWLWRISNDQREAPERELIIRNEAGDIIAQDRTRPQRDPVRGLEFNVDMKDGSKLVVQLPPRPRRAGEGPPGSSAWMRGPVGFFWMLGIVALAVAIGSYSVRWPLERPGRGVRVG